MRVDNFWKIIQLNRSFLQQVMFDRPGVTTWWSQPLWTKMKHSIGGQFISNK